MNYTFKVSSGSNMDGYVRLYVDGQLEVSVEGISNNQRVPTQAWIGFYNDDTALPAQVITVTADDLVVSEADPDACP